MISAKFTTLNLLKTKIFGNKGYDVIIYANDVINKILSHNSSYIANMIM